jgi:transketolase
MRKQLCDALVARADDPSMVFLTGDLGFMALEALQAKMGSRFINAGVAEQNMISVAAAMARQGLDAWVYSIAPFCYARPFEQIRNDITFHRLPVRLIGNGGGYGYGVMGPTHHAIEDYGVLLTLPNMRVYAPVFDEDVADVVAEAGANKQSSYIRLGRGEPPAGYAVPAYAAWRHLIRGEGPPVVVMGPIAGTYIDVIRALPDNRRPNLWAVAELPLSLSPPPQALLHQIESSERVLIVEEHVSQGGLAAAMSLYMLERGLYATVKHLCAQSHHYPRYGSQSYLREKSGLAPQALLNAIGSLG